MKRVYRNILDRYINNDELAFDARLFNLIMLVGLVALSAWAVGNLIEKSHLFVLVQKCAMLALSFVLFVLCNRFRTHHIGRIIAIVGFCYVFFPLLFFRNGGLSGGIAAYFVISIILIVMLSKGRVQFCVFLSVYIAVMAWCFWSDLYHSDWIDNLNVYQIFADNVISIVISGLFVGLIIRGLSSLYILEKKKSDAASKAKGDFLAQMSHEMRTPLNTVIGMTATLENSSDLAQYKAGIRHIETASSHLLGVINDILDISKIEANKFELSEEPFDPARMLEKTLSIMCVDAEKKGVSLTSQIDEDIPDWLFGDRQRLSQVVANLLSNAIKFTPKGGRIDLTANFSLPKDGKYRLLIRVADTGIGITEEQRARLFLSFEQADNSTSRKYGGTGLGLAISKRIVEAMGGRIWVESVFGEGSVFSFEVALPPARKKDESEQLSADPADYDFSHKTILLAEDIDINREIIIALLEPTGVAVVCAEDGRQAVRLFAESPDTFDLVLMDIQMPEMDGNEATRRIRASDAPRADTIPIVAMTANVFKEDIDRAKAAGMNDHLGKPIVIEDVLAKLYRYLK